MKHWRIATVLMLLGVFAVLGACTAPPRTTETTSTPDTGTVPDYSGHKNYVLIPEDSRLRIFVYRGGALARFGHNHVIATSRLSGNFRVADGPEKNLSDSAATLSFNVNDLAIDPAAERERAGPDFPGEISDADKAGTKRNMLSAALLDGAAFPTISVRTVALDGTFPDFTATASIRIRDSDRSVSFPVSVAIDGQRITVNGKTRFSHEELGLEPFSAMLGALTVLNDFDVEYELVGELDEFIAGN